MKLLITGATSFIGRSFCQKALSDGHEVLAVMRPNSTRPEPKGTEVLSLSMEDYNRLGEMAGPCDCFIHLAWDGTRGSARMDTALQQKNVTCSLDAVRSMLQAGCKRIVTAGSQAEYGPHADCITEETECRPNTEYGKWKLDFYHRVSALCEEHAAICMEPRFFSLYGPGDHPHTMVISTLQKMLANEPCPLTEGIQMWDYLHVEDACDALLKLCADPEIPGGVYNFGSGDVRLLRDYILEMARITASRSDLQFGAVPYPVTGMVSLWPEVSKLKSIAHWSPRISFSQGVADMVKQIGESV